MFKDETFLLKEKVLFVFDRREIRLFRVDCGERIEVKDRNFIANILISNAAVLTTEQAKQLVLSGPLNSNCD